MDPAREAGLVIDVLQEIGFDIDDRAELRRPVEPAFRHVALADQQRHFRQKRFEALGRHAAGSLVDRKFAEALQPGPQIRVEDFVQRARLRIDHDQRSRHRLLPNEMTRAKSI